MTTLVAVYRDRTTADAVAAELHDHRGVADDALRVDRFVDGQLVATPVTESPGGVAETIGEFVANTRDPARR